jgi:hypothetical protein
MESSRIIVASLLLLLLAFAATAEARVVRELIGENACQQTCNQVGTAAPHPLCIVLCCNA